MHRERWVFLRVDPKRFLFFRARASTHLGKRISRDPPAGCVAKSRGHPSYRNHPTESVFVRDVGHKAKTPVVSSCDGAVPRFLHAMFPHGGIDVP